MWQHSRARTAVGCLSAVLILMVAGCGGQGDDKLASNSPTAGETASETPAQQVAPMAGEPSSQSGETPAEPGRREPSGELVSPGVGEENSVTSRATTEPAAPFSTPGAGETAVPASVREATATIDLRELPRMEDAIDTHARAALLVYAAPAEVSQAVRFYVQQLAKLDWHEDTDATARRVEERSALVGFTHGGFYLSLSVSPLRDEEGFVQITLRNQGNVDTRKLPRHGDAEVLFGGQATTVYLTAATVDEVVRFTRKELASQGWQEFEPTYRSMLSEDGNAALDFRQKGIALSVYVRPAPGEDERTSVQYDTSVLNHGLPAPPGAEAVEYDDVKPSLRFQIASDIQPVVKFYRGKAKELGWTSKDDLTDTRETSTTVFFEGRESQLYMLNVSKGGEGDKVQVTLEGVLTQPDGA